MIRERLLKIAHKLILPRGLVYHSNPRLENGWNKIDIHFDSSFIKVLYKSNAKDPKGVIVMAHPYLSMAKQFYLSKGHPEVYLKHGYLVVLFDFNGFGESPFRNFGYDLDLFWVVKYFKKLYPNLPFYGHGISFGASNVITTSLIHSDTFDRIIIENCLDTNLSYYRKRSIIKYYLILVVMKLYPNSNKYHNYVESVSKLSQVSQMLLIYNSDDTLTTTSMGQKILNSSNIPAVFKLFEGMHLEAFTNSPDLYEQTIISFIELNAKLHAPQNVISTN